MPDNHLTWLHCSDFHIGKDRTAQERLLGKIVEHVREQVASGCLPDLVFITGDLANRGINAEYNTFNKDFISPLRIALGGDGWRGRILAVPGNHDVDRTKADAFDRAAMLGQGTRVFDPSSEGKAKREILFPRFKAYRQKAGVDVSGNWVSDTEGAYAETIVVRDIKVGVVGLNTAWLSKDEYDKERLTPGVELTEAALEKIGDCQVRFVLGHHPLHWLEEDQAQRLRALFGHHRVVYLHGHLHKAEGRSEDGAGHQFLVFQSGAAFQARDDEPWRNGLLWGKVDVAAGQIRVSPRFWNPTNYDWPVETGRFPENRRDPGADWWVYPLPLKPSQKRLPDHPAWNPPDGWEVLTSERLQVHRRDITREEAVRFFDGAEPEWTFALCPKLPRRALVSELVGQLVNYRGQEKPLVLLLNGPGGEGKSMVFRQAVVDLVEADGELRVLWHAEETRSLPADLADRLPPGPWVIATDAADLTANSLQQATGALRRAGRTDVRLFLCARDSDWRASGAAKLEWWRHADYRQNLLSGLTERDAELIAAAWAELDPSDTAGDAAARGVSLFEAARREAAVNEGSLLGGALAVRRGVGLRDHVHRLLDRLGEHPLASGGTLFHAFGYIAAMHAEGFDFLSRPVLTRVLDCDPRQLGPQVLVPLACEAAAGGGSVLLTRHRRIAEAAVSIMVDAFGEDIIGRLEELARAAKAARPETFILEFKRWEYDLPEHFLDKAPESALRLARAVYDATPKDTRLAVNLARIYRDCNHPAAGAEVLARFSGQVGNNRGYWYEWATCTGKAGKQELSAILGCWSLADEAASGQPDNNQAKLSLAGLGVAFGGL